MGIKNLSGRCRISCLKIFNCLLALSSQWNTVVAYEYNDISADVILSNNSTMNSLALMHLKADIAESLQRVTEILQKASEEVNERSSRDAGGSNCGGSIEKAYISTPWALSHVLSDRYGKAVERLDRVRGTLSNCSEVEISEAMLDLTNQASELVDKAYVLLLDLELEFRSKNTTLPQTLSKNKLQPATRGGDRKCKVDGTRCQFSSCGRGKMLSKCAIGFARGVTGGAQGRSYTVTSSEDDPDNPPNGTLRYAVNLAVAEGSKGVWITFAKDMIIRLREMLWVKSHTTIDGRGVNVTVTGKCVVLAGVKNVILHNFQVSGVRESDTVHIFYGTSKVWVDHLTSFDGKLGLVSVVQGSTDVTISNSHLSNRNFNMLLGASDADTVDQGLRVTVYRNWFTDSRQRMPHCRWGYCHVVNNVYSNWGYYAIGARAHARVYSESNVFRPGKRQEVTPWFRGSGKCLDTTPTIQSSDDLLLNGTTFHQFLRFGYLEAAKYTISANYPPVAPTRTLPELVENCAGALFGPKLQKCMRYSS